MGVHDAAHANVEGGASQQARLILAVHILVTEQCVSVTKTLVGVSNRSKREVRGRMAAETGR